MHCKQLNQNPRRIAILLRTFVLVSGLTAAMTWAAEPAAVRLSAPSLGWVLAADGSQAIEINGITDSPRAGRAVVLPSAGRRSWASPDASSAIVRLDVGLFLLRADERVDQLVELAADVEVSAAWDRSSAGFVLCWAEICQSRGADGAIRSQWEVAASSRVLAFSVEAGVVAATADRAVWYAGTEHTPLVTLPVAAAFRSGTQELWWVDAAGHVVGQDWQGRRAGEGELVENALGVVSSLDGKALFAANAEGAAAVLSLDGAQTEKWNVEDTVEGVWAAPGLLAVRLHESAKRPIAIWNGETRSTGWMPASPAPAVDTEVRQ
jgi:hypothetical protein